MFYKKNITKLRMSFNYVSAIYLISILFLSLISQSEPILKVNLSLILLMLLINALVSLRYKEDKIYSLILFIALFGYYITTIKNNLGYYAIFMTSVIYFISLFIEKYLKNQLSLVDFNKKIKENIILLINNFRKINISDVKRLKSGRNIYSIKNIQGYSVNRIYRYNDFNRRKVFKSKENIQKYVFNLKLKNKKIDSFKKMNSNNNILKEIKKRLKYKKRQKRQEKIDKFLDTTFVKLLFTIILILTAIFIMYTIYKYARDNIVFNFSFNRKGIYIIYYIPLIYIILKTIYFLIFKFKKIDSEYIMLTLLIFFVLFIDLINIDIILDFSSSIILSIFLVILNNKIYIGNTKRDIETLKEQNEYKKGLKYKRRVAFGISSLNIGGVSRILVDLCNGLSKKYSNLDIEIFTLFAGGEFEEGVDVKIVSLFKKPFNSYKKFSRLLISIYLRLFEPNIFNKYIRGNYDTIIAFDEGDITSMFSYHDDAKKVAWIHNKTYSIYAKENKKYL